MLPILLSSDANLFYVIYFGADWAFWWLHSCFFMGKVFVLLAEIKLIILRWAH